MSCRVCATNHICFRTRQATLTRMLCLLLLLGCAGLTGAVNLVQQHCLSLNTNGTNGTYASITARRLINHSMNYPDDLPGTESNVCRSDVLHWRR